MITYKKHFNITSNLVNSKELKDQAPMFGYVSERFDSDWYLFDLMVSFIVATSSILKSEIR